MAQGLLTTNDVDAADRPAFWREVICAAYVELDAEPLSRTSFSGSVTLSEWGDVRLSRVEADGQIVTRRVADRQSDCLVSIQMSGIGRVTQSGRTAVLKPGDLALYDTTRPYELAFDDPFDQIVMQFSRDSLISRNVHIESAVALCCAGQTGAGAVASSFAQTLLMHGHDLPDAFRGRLGLQALDCVAAALALMAGSMATKSAVHTFDRQRVLTFIDANLTNPNLSVGFIGRAFGISTRTLQKLFADDEVHLGEHIQRTRLSHARMALRDPLRSHQTIARIADEFGFSDAAHFSRAFRSAFGCTPREYRHA